MPHSGACHAMPLPFWASCWPPLHGVPSRSPERMKPLPLIAGWKTQFNHNSWVQAGGPAVSLPEASSWEALSPLRVTVNTEDVKVGGLCEDV